MQHNWFLLHVLVILLRQLIRCHGNWKLVGFRTCTFPLFTPIIRKWGISLKGKVTSEKLYSFLHDWNYLKVLHIWLPFRNKQILKNDNRMLICPQTTDPSIPETLNLAKFSKPGEGDSQLSSPSTKDYFIYSAVLMHIYSEVSSIKSSMLTGGKARKREVICIQLSVK